MSRPGILLDRDGTIIEDCHYPGHIERVQLIPGAAQAIAAFNRAGIPVAIITNQGGVARGFYPERNVHLVHEYITRELALHDAHIDLFLYSPHHPEAFDNRYRRDPLDHKPGPGMAFRASRALRLDLSQSWVVGDRVEDMTMAGRIGAHAIHVGKERLHKPPGSKPASFHHFPSLAASANFIIKQITGADMSSFPAHGYASSAEYFGDYIDSTLQALSSIDPQQLSGAIEYLTGAYRIGRKVFVAGNGGAAALSDHFACDHNKGVSTDTSLFTNVTSLTANTALLTAIANDIGYDAVFSYQLEHVAEPGDVLVVFSASGNSANIVRAVQYALEHRISVIGITGFDGGKVRGLANARIHIDSSNYGIVEDVMQMIMHSMAQFIRQSVMPPAAVKSARF